VFGHDARSYVVECYWPGVSEDKLGVTVERLQAATEALCRSGGDVRFVSAILVPADETVLYLLDGHPACVRKASEQASIPFERVLECLRTDGQKVVR
jgi:hypothetical protein